MSYLKFAFKQDFFYDQPIIKDYYRLSVNKSFYVIDFGIKIWFYPIF